MSIYNFCNFLYRFFFRSGGAVILLNGNHGSDPSLSVEVLKAQNMAQAIGNRDRTMARTECKGLAIPRARLKKIRLGTEYSHQPSSADLGPPGWPHWLGRQGVGTRSGSAQTIWTSIYRLVVIIAPCGVMVPLIFPWGLNHASWLRWEIPSMAVEMLRQKVRLEVMIYPARKWRNIDACKIDYWIQGPLIL